MIDTLQIWQQCILVFISQVAFIYFRTVNVVYVSDKDRWGVFWSGALVNICWLISVSIGVSAIMTGNVWLIASNVIGGLAGADWAIRRNGKKV